MTDNSTNPLTRAQAIALCAKDMIICQPHGCHEDDLEPNSGDVDGWWQCGKCGSALTMQIALAFQDEPLSLVNQAIVYMHGGGIVLHVQALITGRITRVHGPNEYRDKGGNLIDQHVVEFEDGNAFILPSNERVLVPLTGYQVQVLEQLGKDLRTLMTGAFVAIRAAHKGEAVTLMGGSEEMKRDVDATVLLLRTALMQQLRALGA